MTTLAGRVLCSQTVVSRSKMTVEDRVGLLVWARNINLGLDTAYGTDLRAIFTDGKKHDTIAKLMEKIQLEREPWRSSICKRRYGD